MLGKVNCDAWAIDHRARIDFEQLIIPEKGYVPGGTSSGSAASVAANLSLIATGQTRVVQ